MKMAVIDACFSGAWLLPDENTLEAEKILAEALRGEWQLAVPSLWDYETCNLLVAAVRRNRIDENRLEPALELMARISVNRYTLQSPLTQLRILRLARRFDLTCYDASYLELADRLRARLFTFDRRLTSAAAELGLT